jgi:alpha-beta hydrolase superfamily lysophospholipase
VKTREVGGRLCAEIWYPATDDVAGLDLDEASQDCFRVLPVFRPVSQRALRDAPPREGRFPLVLFSHGFGGHRRQSTFLTTHLASRGFVVAAIDHPGGTVADLMSFMTEKDGQPEILGSQVEGRVTDFMALLDDCVAAVDDPVLGKIDSSRVAAIGHSYGGYTGLLLAGLRDSLAACVPMGPPGGIGSSVSDALLPHLRASSAKATPTLFLAARDDSIVPLESVLDLARRLDSAPVCVLDDADHLHFCDSPEGGHEMFRTIPRCSRVDSRSGYLISRGAARR